MAGVLGPIREVHIWCSHPIYPCSLVRPAETQTPPPGMNWDLWIGPAPYRPFNSAYHPETWRPWWDFGGGTVADMACHALHMFYEELQLEAAARLRQRLDPLRRLHESAQDARMSGQCQRRHLGVPRPRRCRP